MLEKDIERPFVRYAQRRGCMAVKFSDPARRGAPDRLVMCKKGKTFFIEFKSPGKLPRHEQIEYHIRLGRLGFEVFVCDDLEQAKGILDDFLSTFVSAPSC